MIKRLGDCNIGDFVTLWCIGLCSWDDDVVKITEKGPLITIEYRNGNIGKFSPLTQCKIASF